MDPFADHDRRNIEERSGYATSDKPLTSGWTFLTNHSHVLVCLSEDPHARVRDVADRVGITERAVLRILTELEEAGIIIRHRDGRRNHYEIRGEQPLRHPIENHCTIQDLLTLLRR